MQVQVNTDHNIEGRDALVSHVTGVVEHALANSRGHITRVEVHLGDEVGHKSGIDDKRCVMEARLEGRPPVAVTHHAGSLHQAVDGAATKLNRKVESTLDKLRGQKRGAAGPSAGEAGDAED